MNRIIFILAVILTLGLILVRKDEQMDNRAEVIRRMKSLGI